MFLSSELSYHTNHTLNLWTLSPYKYINIFKLVFFSFKRAIAAKINCKNFRIWISLRNSLWKVSILIHLIVTSGRKLDVSISLHLPSTWSAISFACLMVRLAVCNFTWDCTSNCSVAKVWLDAVTTVVCRNVFKWSQNDRLRSTSNRCSTELSTFVWRRFSLGDGRKTSVASSAVASVTFENVRISI